MCVGGPLDGGFAEGAFFVGQTEFSYSRIVSGCKCLDGDCLVGGFEPKYASDTYRLHKFFVPFSGSFFWEYSVWLHESISLTEAVTKELFHPSDCFVVRHFNSNVRFQESPIFQYGLLKMSRN